MDKHELISDLKAVIAHLGRIPSRREYLQHGKHLYAYESAFHLWTNFLAAAVGDHSDPNPSDKGKKFKFKQQKLESFTVHELDLKEIFDLCGNPQTLKVIAQPDTHDKHKDEKAFSCFLSFMNYFQPHGLINLGDFLDSEGISHWPSDSFEPKRYIPEILSGRETLWAINEHSKSCKFRVFITGNHEDWLRQALIAKLPELYDGAKELGLLPTFESLLELDKFGYQVIPLNHFLKIGKAYFTHGMYTTDNHPKKHLETLKRNIYYGHLHDTKSYNTISIDGPMEAASLGCLCKLDAKFLKGRPNNWVHAFGVFEFFPDGSYTFICPKIINGRLSYNGIVFE